MAFCERRIGAQDGLSLYVRDYGDPLAERLPLLCLTGITRNAKDYHRLALREAGRRRVVVPDYRGRGRSGWDPQWRHYVATTYLNDLVQVLASLDLPRAVVVGTSMGGLLAMGLHALKPTLIAGLVLNDIGPDIATNGSARILDRIGRDRPEPDLATAARTLKAEMPTLSAKTDADWIAAAERTYRQAPDGLWHVDWDIRLVWPLLRRTEPTPDLWALFRGLKHVPTLAIRGGLSDLLTVEGLARMVAVKPDLVTITAPGVGHAPFLDEPEIEGPLDEFLSRF